MGVLRSGVDNLLRCKIASMLSLVKCYDNKMVKLPVWFSVEPIDTANQQQQKKTGKQYVSM